MDIYIYTREFEYVGIVDRFESFIWTERYSEAGDFEIYTPVTDELLDKLKEERFLVINESSNFMVIENVEITTDAENGDFIKVTGRSGESILERRIIWYERKYENYSVQSIIKQLLTDNIIDPIDSDRKVDGLIFSESQDPAIGDLVVEETGYYGENLYDAIKALCDAFSLGFKLELNDRERMMVFSLYKGADHSYDQDTNPYVVFSKKYGNLLSSDYSRSTTNIKNTALILGEPGFWLNEGEANAQYYAQMRSETGDGSWGLDRREVFVDGTDISRTVNDEDAGTQSERTGNEGESGGRLPVTAWSKGGIAPAGLIKGDYVQTNGGMWQIADEDTPGAQYNPVSGYWSVKVDNTTKMDNPDPISPQGGSVMAWSVNGQAPSGLDIGTYVQTGGGIFKIVAPGTEGANYNPNSGYYSIKINDNTKSAGLTKGVLRAASENITVYSVNGQAPSGLDIGTFVQTNGGLFKIIGLSSQDIRHNTSTGYWSLKMPSDFEPEEGDTVVDAVDGQAPAGLSVGTYVRTAGGYFKIIGTGDQDIRYNPSSGYYSLKINSTPKPETSSDTGNPSSDARILDGEDYAKLLRQKGDEALSDYARSAEESFNAEVVTIHTFLYGEDYGLGDILQIINEYGIGAKVRVSEYIRSISTSGSNYYPTFITV